MDTQPEGAVVVGVDGSDKDWPAVDWAADEAAAVGAPLHVVHAFPFLTPGDGALPAATVEELGERVTAQVTDRVLVRHPSVRVSRQVVVDDPAVALVEASREARCVVVGARGLGRIAGRLLGSVSQKVAAHAHGTVVVVRHGAPAPGGPVVVGVDPADTPPDVLAFAFAQAARRGVGVRLLHALPGPGGSVDDPRVQRVLESIAEQDSAALARLAEEWSGRYPEVPVEVRETVRHPIDVLTEESAGAGLVVVGTRGRGAFEGMLLCSVSHAVIHGAECVLAVV